MYAQKKKVATVSVSEIRNSNTCPTERCMTYNLCLQRHKETDINNKINRLSPPHSKNKSGKNYSVRTQWILHSPRWRKHFITSMLCALSGHVMDEGPGDTHLQFSSTTAS